MTFPEKTPIIVGSIVTPEGLRLLGSHPAGSRRAGSRSPADVMEVRVDALLAEKVAPAAIAKALQARKHPALLTLRIPAEGGRLAWKPKARRELFAELLPLADAIDVELATAAALAEVVETAKLMEKTVILSAHALKKAATTAQLTRWLARFEAHWMENFRPQPRLILKIAAHCATWDQVQRLAKLLVDHHEWPLAVMGLGPYGAASRQVLASLGSRLAYGYLDAPAAPGQPSAAEVWKLIRSGAPLIP